jgi:hypothetical protein
VDVWFVAQGNDFFLAELMKLEQWSRKCVELRGEYVKKIYFSIS